MCMHGTSCVPCVLRIFLILLKGQKQTEVLMIRLKKFIYFNFTSPGSMHDTGCLGLVQWDDPEGWYREEEVGFRMGNTCTPVADSC